MELFLVAIAYLFGILMGLYLKIGIAFIVAFCIILYIFRKKSKYIKLFCTKKYIILFLAFLLISFMQINYLENQFNKKYKNIQGTIKVIGTIISNPIEKDNSITYKLKIEKINNNNSYKNTNLKLYVKKEKNKKTYKYGDKIALIGEFEEPEVQRNTGGFDYKKYLKTQNIYGIIKANEIKLIKKNNVNLMNILINKIANKVEENANALLPREEASILIGILIGNKEYLEEETIQAFQKSNLSHMLAVSGAHASYVVMAIGFIITKTKISKKMGKIITILLLLFFMLLTGKTPSVTRACIMSIYMIMASLFHKRATIISSMSISILFLIIYNPYCVLDIGLQLSYGGTIGIIVIYNMLKNGLIMKEKLIPIETKILNTSKIKEILLLSISANIIIIPITLYHFNTLSLTFLISNIFASPLLGIIIILGFISISISFTFFPLAKVISIPLGMVIKIFYKIATNVGNLPFSQIYVPTPKISTIIIYYIIIAITIFYYKLNNKSQKRKIEKTILKNIKKITLKKIFLTIFIISIIFSLYRQIPKNLNIYFIDVGQGDSTLIVTPRNKTILIDGGGSTDNKAYDIGKNTLIPYLLDRGIIKLDYIMISHFDADHATGAIPILGKIDVSNIILTKQLEENDIYRQILSISKEKKIRLIYVKEGDVLKIGGIKISIIHPENKLMINNPMNNNSIVCKIEYNSFSMLLTGDIEKEAEELILKKNKDLKADILKIAHHGSKSSTTEVFLRAVNPKIALIGVGKNNNFGHPSNDVIQRLKENGARIYRTDENGEISIRVNKKGKITKIQKCIT